MRTLDQVIAENPAFRGLGNDELELIAGCASNVGFEAGDQLFREGEPADAFFIVRRGLVALEAQGGNRRVTVETVSSGEIVGWSWLVSPYRWHFTGRAIEPVRAVQFDGACLRRKSDEDPALGYHLLTSFAQILADRLDALRLQLTDMYGTSPLVAPLA